MWRQSYRQYFSISEIEHSPRLRWLFWGILALSLFDLSSVSFISQSVYGNDTCWAFFPNCTQYVKLDHLPFSYLYTGIMAGLLSLHLWSGVSAYKNKWIQAHFSLGLIIIWKFLFHFVFRDTGKQNFEYFMLIPAFVYLFSKDKLVSFRWVWACLYFFAASVKFHEAWIAGSYFTSMQLGLPLVPSFLTTPVSQAAILFEIFFSFGLVSQHHRYRVVSFWLWVGFHLYSVFLVGYFYPIRCLVYLFLAFYPLKPDLNINPASFKKRPLFIAFLSLLFGLHIFPLVKERDAKFTFEGLGSGFFMFDSNHQCFIQVRLYDQEKTLLYSDTRSLIEPRSRCSPWHVVQKIQRMCQQYGAASAEYIHDHSINGGPVYRMVDEKQACQLHYNFWGKNPWIKDRSEDLLIVGYPYPNQIGVQNRREANYYSRTPVISVSRYQQWVLENLKWIKSGLIILWFSVLIFGVWRIFILTHNLNRQN